MRGQPKKIKATTFPSPLSIIHLFTLSFQVERHSLIRVVSIYIDIDGGERGEGEADVAEREMQAFGEEAAREVLHPAPLHRHACLLAREERRQRRRLALQLYFAPIYIQI